jgi:hypothetical protein
LLQALGVRGSEAELRVASQEFGGHCLALTLLGSYLSDAYEGDIRYRGEVSKHLADDVRQGAHARKVMASYQSWWGEGPELSLLRLLGLFDRPSDERALGVLLKPPAIPALTGPLTDLNPSEWRTLLARLRRARLLTGEDPQHPGQVDAHPLVREYFGQQLRTQCRKAWQQANRRLYEHYRTLAPERPETFREMEPLFLAVACGCQAGLFRDALHQVYIPRIQRGEDAFAAKVLGARGALLSALSHFFEHGRWGSVVQRGLKGQRLMPDDQLFVLMQAALYLVAMRGQAAPEARLCYERAEPLCQELNRLGCLYLALIGQWRYLLNTGQLRATMQLAQQVYREVQGQRDAAILVGSHRALAVTRYFLGEFEAAGQELRRGIETWRSAGVPSAVEELDAPIVSCLSFEAVYEWHLGQVSPCQATTAEAISVAMGLNDGSGANC